MGNSLNIAVAGATGAVGQEMLKTLENSSLPMKSLKLLASKRSAGKTLNFKGEQKVIEELTENSFDDVDIALFSAGGDRSKEFAPAAAKASTVVVDNSSAFRMDPETPLVVPEVNPEDIDWHKGIIANPNCTTILMLVALKPLHDISPIQRVIVSTYQSASGAGAKAMEELRVQSEQYLNGQTVEKNVLPHQAAFNLFSHNSDIDENGYCKEEMKMVHESRKMLHSENLRVSPTTIRVPVFRTHAEAITVEQNSEVTVEQAREAFQNAPGLKVVDDRENNYFPMPVDAAERPEVLVGRIRRDLSQENSLSFFICGDQLLKGAALNAVQIAEKVAEKL